MKTSLLIIIFIINDDDQCPISVSLSLSLSLCVCLSHFHFGHSFLVNSLRTTQKEKYVSIKKKKKNFLHTFFSGPDFLETFSHYPPNSTSCTMFFLSKVSNFFAFNFQFLFFFSKRQSYHHQVNLFFQVFFFSEKRDSPADNDDDDDDER